MALTLVLASCGRSELRSFWETHSVDYTDIQAAEDQFADFAELAVAGPEKEALKAMDGLFDELKKDPVAYYIYADWVVGAFYNLLSPCRNPQLFSKAVDRMEKDGIFAPDECERFAEKRRWIRTNLPGAEATVPGVPSPLSSRTLVLVLDLGCPTCREALELMGQDPQWEGLDKIAVGCGRGPVPQTPGWVFVREDPDAPVFDPHMTPIYFVIAEDGTVEIPYTLALHD